MNRLVLVLTDEQSAQIELFMAPGFVLLGKVGREAFDAELGNATTCGRLQIELGSVPESCLPKLREVIQRANK